MKTNKKNTAIIQMSEKGYFYESGNIVSPFSNKPLTPTVDKRDGYLGVHIRVGIDTYKIDIHRFVAYKKFGDKIFELGIHVRHLDSNKLNNHPNNLELGTASDNSMDRPESERIASALHATAAVKKFDHEAIIKRKNEGASYKEIMNEFGITSKGTISFIINKSYSLKSTK